ncbi:MAG: phenylacetate-CoA oxygenase subunit PaaC [Actinobacteria bacterium]|nr:phenylacetate-CoA oxygenase subunit PaaC [Actinomycetota bacterium]
MSDALVALAIALGDDELILGHRHSEWTGYAPHIEEDVAFSSIAQDEIGHAAAFYAIAARANGETPDQIAFGREVAGYRNARFCERPNREWAYTLARHWLYDTADDLRLESLRDSSNSDLAQLATKIRREERYHLLHADMWVRRLAEGPVKGRTKLAHALTDAFTDIPGLFEPFELEDEAIEEGLLPVPSGELRDRLVRRAEENLEKLRLSTVITSDQGERAEFVASSSGDLIAADGDSAQRPSGADALGGRRGDHTDDFLDLWKVMTVTYRQNPGATW